jgi:hypothetical protein
MHQADTGGQSDQLGSIVKAELSIDPMEVGADRLAGETQLPGDFGRGAAICRQPKNLALSGASRAGPPSARIRWRPLAARPGHRASDDGPSE